jgi:hypothetical protein
MAQWCDDDVAAAIRLVDVDTRPRKERRGQRIARVRAREGGREGKEKGGAVAMGRPL